MILHRQPSRPLRSGRQTIAEEAVNDRTQEVRLATTITGGVSLAVWMGGLVRELNLLLQASRQREACVAPQAEAAADQPLIVLYRRLLDLLDLTVDVDVVSGTSAGGINAVFLALARVNDRDLGSMRDMWLDLGAFLDLLRDPADTAFPSLLYGDRWMYEHLITELRPHCTPEFGRTQTAPPTSLHVTTTLLSGEPDPFTDAFGTQVPDTNHRGVFTFHTADLTGAAAAEPLALAARSTASFPGAFEPSFIPIHGTTAGPDRPDMAAFANFAHSHWVADGGVLNNQPLGLVLDEVFARPADRDVRRALLYVVPTTTPSIGARLAAPDSDATPYGLVDGLMKNVSAVMKQSVAEDFTAIRRHNDHVTGRRTSRLQLLALAGRLPADARLLSSELLCAAIEHSAKADARRLTRALLHAAHAGVPSPDTPPEEPPSQALLETRIATRIAAGSGSTRPPTDPAQFGRYGRALLDIAKAIGLAVLHAALDIDDRTATSELTALIGELHQAVAVPHPTPLHRLATEALAAAAGSLIEAADALADTYVERETVPPQAWLSLGRILTSPTLGSLATDGPPADESACLPDSDDPRAVLRRYLDYFLAPEMGSTPDEGGPVAGSRRLFDLAATERALLPVDSGPDQPLHLIQASAETTTLLDPDRSTAQQKLTGLQLRNFGAFYKRSWRANDWMWGRLDGARPHPSGPRAHPLPAPDRRRSHGPRPGVRGGARRARGGCVERTGSARGAARTRLPRRRHPAGTGEPAQHCAVAREALAGGHREGRTPPSRR